MLRLSRTCEDTAALLGNAHRAHPSGGQQLLNMLRPSSCVNSTVEKFQFGKWRRLGVRLEMFIPLDAGAWLEERGEGEQQHAALGVDHSEHHGGDREIRGRGHWEQRARLGRSAQRFLAEKGDRQGDPHEGRRISKPGGDPAAGPSGLSSAQRTGRVIEYRLPK